MITILGCAFVVMLILKLADLVAWSWWIIASPLWVPAAAIAMVGVSMRGCRLWDQYMNWFPCLPIFWFDNPKYANSKLALSILGLVLILIIR